MVSLPAAEDPLQFVFGQHIRELSIPMALEQEISMLLHVFLNNKQIWTNIEDHVIYQQSGLAGCLAFPPLNCLIPAVWPFGDKWKAEIPSVLSCPSAKFGHSVPHCMNSSLHVNAITVIV